MWETIYIIMCKSNNEWGSVVRRKQAHSRSQCTERKTWLFLLHVGAGMESVLFIWNITCLYSDWISRFNSMLVHDCLAAGWEQGFELWLFQKGWGLEQLVSQRDRLKPDFWAAIMAGQGLKTHFWHSFSPLCPAGNFTENILLHEVLAHEVLA